MLIRLVALTVAIALPCAKAALAPEEQKLVQVADRIAPDFGKDLERAVAIDSATENLAGVRAMSEHFAAQLRDLGFETRFIPLPPEMKRAGHLVAERKGSRGKRVLLIGHLDTVYPGANAKLEGNKISGAGTGDMKGGDLVMIYALRALRDAGLLDGTQIIVVMTGDEEATGQPESISRRDLLEAAQRSDVALAYESAVGLTGTVARRGIVMWKLEVQGATGHSSGMFSAAMGFGAVYEMARILDEFRQAATSMDGVTLNPAIVTAGATAELETTGGKASGKANVIAQRALARGDLRFIDATQLATMQERMRAIVAKHLLRTSGELTFLEGFPAMPASKENYALLAELNRASQDLGLGEITAFDPRGRGAGDVAFVSPPLPALDGLGLGGNGEHTPHESSDLTPAPALIKRSALLIYRLTR